MANASNGPQKSFEQWLIDFRIPDPRNPRCHRGLLAEAVREGQVAVVRALIKMGASLDPKGAYDEDDAPLHHAVKARDLEMVNILLEAGADVDASGHNAETPLMLAASLGDKAIVERLIQAGANVRSKKFTGENALDCAVSKGHDDIAKTLRLSRRVNRSRGTHTSSR